MNFLQILIYLLKILHSYTRVIYRSQTKFDYITWHKYVKVYILSIDNWELTAALSPQSALQKKTIDIEFEYSKKTKSL